MEPAPPPAKKPSNHPLVPLTKLLLGAYWILLFASTHLPEFLFPAVGPEGNDKILHFLGFFGLATLWQLAIVAQRSIDSHDRRRIALGLAAYALFDELSQILVDRTADPLDWLADMAGVLVALAAFAPLSRRIRQLRWWPQQSH